MSDKAEFSLKFDSMQHVAYTGGNCLQVQLLSIFVTKQFWEMLSCQYEYKIACIVTGGIVQSYLTISLSDSERAGKDHLPYNMVT